MLAPFVACMVLVAIHSYLGLHVIAREVIFVDLSLAQMAGLGSVVALLYGVAPDSRTAFIFSLVFTCIGAALFAMTRTRGKGRSSGSCTWSPRRPRFWWRIRRPAARRRCTTCSRARLSGSRGPRS